IGAQAGDAITTGSNNIIIGNNIDAPSATGSNQLNIGNTIYGDISGRTIGIGDFSADTIDSTLHIQSGDITMHGGAGNQKGCIRYNDTTDKMQFSHDCSTFTDMAGAAGATTLNSVAAATADQAGIANAAWNIRWNWALTGAETGFTFGESAASSGGSDDQYIL